jgi:rhamnosyltransferase
MTQQSICAIVVTYHPTADMIDSISAMSMQAQDIVIVDNGSTSDELRRLHAAKQTLRFHLIENGQNLGIAEALNQGVLWAKSKGYPWVILFDQDSKITPGFIGQMLDTWEAHPDRDRVCSIHPRYLNPETGFEPYVWRAKDGGPVTSMTSGALMPTWIFDEIGMFAAEYFIDLVDHEYCLRIRRAGYFIADSREAVLFHTAGSPKEVSFFGFHFRPTHHSAVRHYYFSRNRIALYRKYLLFCPGWILRFMYRQAKEMTKCLLTETSRARKCRNFFLGTWDGLTGRMGKREDL